MTPPDWVHAMCGWLPTGDAPQTWRAVVVSEGRLGVGVDATARPEASGDESTARRAISLWLVRRATTILGGPLYRTFLRAATFQPPLTVDRMPRYGSWTCRPVRYQRTWYDRSAGCSNGPERRRPARRLHHQSQRDGRAGGGERNGLRERRAAAPG